MGRLLLDGKDIFREDMVGKRLWDVLRERGIFYEEVICIDRRSNKLIVNPRVSEDSDWEVRRILSRG